MILEQKNCPRGVGIRLANYVLMDYDDSASILTIGLTGMRYRDGLIVLV
jgi:hypothetical protein